MVRIITLLTILCSYSFAEACESKTIYTKTNGDKVTLCFHSEKEDFVTESCLTDCKANKYLGQKVSIKPKELKGGKDAHSVACTKLHGKLNLYRDEKQNEYAFCEAEDGSAVSADLIEYKTEK